MTRIAAFAMAITAALALATPAFAEFRLETFFAGRTTAEGSFRAINGVNRKFHVDLNGSWNGKRLRLVEKFRYDDGMREIKTWTFVKVADGEYLGTRDDVDGQAHVKIRGDTARYAYYLFLDAEQRRKRVRFHDRMTLNADGTVTGGALVTKFGLPVGRLRVAFQPAGGPN